MPDIAHTWTEHTYTEPFTMTQEIRIPQVRHRLHLGQPFIWQCYGYDDRLIFFDGCKYMIDHETGEFWMRLLKPLPTPLRGTIVLTGVLQEE